MSGRTVRQRRVRQRWVWLESGRKDHAITQRSRFCANHNCGIGELNDLFALALRQPSRNRLWRCAEFPCRQRRLVKLDAIQQANREGKELLIYDEVGKQVRWLMYYLEDNNAPNYYFMKGGVREYFKFLRAQL